MQRGPVFGEPVGNDAGSWEAVAVIAEIMAAWTKGEVNSLREI